jgi:hypothetical protein
MKQLQVPDRVGDTVILDNDEMILVTLPTRPGVEIRSLSTEIVLPIVPNL